MTRSFFAVGAALAVAFLASAPGCKATGVGDPCVPEQEYDPSFLGFSEKQVNVESKSFQCQTRLCLVDHFRGRASCEGGQDENGVSLDPSKPDGCTIPGTNQKITGKVDDKFLDDTRKARVCSQCQNRRAADAVYCSCRCADVDGKTTDGTFCTCPEGFACRQLVSSIGASDKGLTGAYCVKSSTPTDFGICASLQADGAVCTGKD